MGVQGQEPAQAGLKMGQVLISGRLAGVRSISTRQGRKWLHKVQLPAPDEFTSPSVVEVRGDEKLGERVGDVIRCKAQLGGYGRSFNFTDKETGERLRGEQITMTLDVI